MTSWPSILHLDRITKIQIYTTFSLLVSDIFGLTVNFLDLWVMKYLAFWVLPSVLARVKHRPIKNSLPRHLNFIIKKNKIKKKFCFATKMMFAKKHIYANL